MSAMALPDHVKRQAMDAVSNKETTAQIRLYRNNAPSEPSSPTNEKSPVTKGSIPDSVKKQAMDAVGNKETVSQIRLVKDNGSPWPTGTPGKDTHKAAEKIAQLGRTGHDADSIHRQATKDNFGR